MKKFSLSSNDWLRIGIEMGWMKQAKWSDIFNTKTPAEKAFVEREKSQRSSLMQHLRTLEAYTAKLVSMNQTISQIKQMLENDPLLLSYIRNFKGGDELAKQMLNISTLERSFYDGAQLMQAAMQRTISEGKPLTQETGQDIHAATSPLNTTDGAENLNTTDSAPADTSDSADMHSVDANDIIFECPSCKQSLEAGPEAAGRDIHCPSCKSPITVPSVSPASPEEKPASEPAEPVKEPAATPEEKAPEESSATITSPANPPQKPQYPYFKHRQKAFYWPASKRTDDKTTPTAEDVIPVRVTGTSVDDPCGDMGKDKIPVTNAKGKKFYAERRFLFPKQPPVTHPKA